MKSQMRVFPTVFIVTMILTVSKIQVANQTNCQNLDWSQVERIQPDYSLELPVHRTVIVDDTTNLVFTSDNEHWNVFDMSARDNGQILEYFPTELAQTTTLEPQVMGIVHDNNELFFSATNIVAQGAFTTGNLVRWNLSTLQPEVIENDVSVTNLITNHDYSLIAYTRNFQNVHVMVTDNLETIYVSDAVGREGGSPIFSPTEDIMAYIAEDAIKVVDIHQQTEITSIPLPNPNLFELKFSPDGQYLLGLFDQYLLFAMWNIRTGEMTISREPDDHFQIIRYDFHPANHWLTVAISGNNTIWTYDYDSGELLDALEIDVLSPSFTSMLYLNDGYDLALTDWQGQLIVWDFRTNTSVFNQSFTDQITIGLSQDKDYLILRSSQQTLFWRCAYAT